MIPIASVLVAALASAPAEASASDRSPTAILASMARAASALDDYTAVLLKQEWLGEGLEREVRFFVKWRRPASLYLKHLEEPAKGREVIWVAGRNQDRLKVHPASFPWFDVDLDPRGKIALGATHHPIDETNLPRLVALVVGNVTKAEAAGELTSATLPAERFDGVDCLSVAFAAPARTATTALLRGETLFDVAKRTGQAFAPILHANRARGWKHADDPRAGESVVVPRYYATRVEILVDPSTALPRRVLLYDLDGKLFERFEYHDLALRAGLGDADFDPGNPEYGF